MSRKTATVNFFFFKSFFDVMVNFDQVICGAAVFPEASLLWAYEVLGFHEPG
jgi:hypothetical protein